MFESFYGAIGISVILYFTLKTIRRDNEKDKIPMITTAIVALIGVLILSSIPRPNFEKEIMAKIADKPWIKVAHKSKVVRLTEPYTWFSSSINSITLISPGDALRPGFHLTNLTYNKKPSNAFVDPDCTKRQLDYAKADNEGIYRQDDKNMYLKMNAQEYALYCKQDWSAEIIAINRAMMGK